jgi:hypothetical protein
MTAGSPLARAVFPDRDSSRAPSKRGTDIHNLLGAKQFARIEATRSRLFGLFGEY